ncbi:MAG TPA: hypothetical protein VF276_04485 [Chloroflexia bacterium]
MSSNADSQGRAWGTAEEAVRRQAGLDDPGNRPAADNATPGPSRAIDSQEPVDPATAVGSPPAREDVESIHDEVAGFVDAGATDAKGGTTPPAEN